MGPNFAPHSPTNTLTRRLLADIWFCISQTNEQKSDYDKSCGSKYQYASPIGLIDCHLSAQHPALNALNLLGRIQGVCPPPTRPSTPTQTRKTVQPPSSRCIPSGIGLTPPPYCHRFSLKNAHFAKLTLGPQAPLRPDPGSTTLDFHAAECRRKIRWQSMTHCNAGDTSARICTNSRSGIPEPEAKQKHAAADAFCPACRTEKGERRARVC